jgi:4-diphosphocytidyl-2-C-methyl-D-erythritol kinase
MKFGIFAPKLSPAVILFPNGKINLGLTVTGKRPDGFHDIETIFFPVPLKDALEIVPSGETAISLQVYGLPINGNPEDNLCIKAWQLIKQQVPGLPAVSIHLLKKIPMGAGLGGGSADGAFMLRLLNEQFELHLSKEQLLAYALKLGSDCPFFIYNEPCYATGRGEVLEPVLLNLSGYTLALYHPGIHVNTGWAFQQLQRPEKTTSSHPLKKMILEPVHNWKENLTNDFEQPVFQQYPAIAAIKEQFYQTGAVYAAMSGSGSTVFALFEKGRYRQSLLPTGTVVVSL